MRAGVALPGSLVSVNMSMRELFEPDKKEKRKNSGAARPLRSSLCVLCEHLRGRVLCAREERRKAPLSSCLLFFYEMETPEMGFFYALGPPTWEFLKGCSLWAKFGWERQIECGPDF